MGHKKTALITGITGQDGSYLTKFLLDKGYQVHGLRRRTSQFNTGRIDHLYHDLHEQGKPLFLHHGDMSDALSIANVIRKSEPDEIYNLAAQSHVMVSFEQPEYTADVNALGTLRVLEAMRIFKLEDKTKFYQASTSELFGGNPKLVPQDENTPFDPKSPYAVSKLYAYWITRNYRESYNMYACNGILFNHESPYRGETFVTRKITRALSRIKLGKQKCLYLGNLGAMRDWGHAKDYVEMQWLMLQQDNPKDYVISTGRQASVREFVELACKYLNLELTWEGTGIEEKGLSKNGEPFVQVDPMYFRPSEVQTLLGDSSKAKRELNWEPKINLEKLVEEMCKEDLKIAEKE